MSNSVRPHRQQPTRLPRPWDFPGKNTGVGCHFLLQNMKVKSESEVAHSCPTLSILMDCSLPGSSVHGIFQARVLEWGAIAFSYETAEEANSSYNSSSTLNLINYFKHNTTTNNNSSNNSATAPAPTSSMISVTHLPKAI